MVKTGRGQNIHVERENRKCLLCNSDAIGDEYHYIFNFSAFDNCKKNNVLHFTIEIDQTH